MDGFDVVAEATGIRAGTLAEAIARVRSPTYARWTEQVAATGSCARPIRLKGHVLRDGHVAYSTADEPDGVLLTACGNRRKALCPSCSYTYAGDMWQLIHSGMVGGKGIPGTVKDHPMVFATLTAPSFGAVHGCRDGKACRPRRDHQRCRHGKPQWCNRTHSDDDLDLGQALCPDCYDYPRAALFNWWAPELWRRFTIDLRRVLAHQLGLTAKQFKVTLGVCYGKVAEYQQRGVVHFHAIVRLDGPGDDFGPPAIEVTAEQFAQAVTTAARQVWYDADIGEDRPVKLRFGSQVDVQAINGAPVDGELTAQAVAAYIAKYACKGAEDFGLGGRALDPITATERAANPHIVSMVAACHRLAEQHPSLAGLSKWTHMLGFRGHFASKSRRYSTTLGKLRQARADYRRRKDLESRGLPADDADENTILVVGEWTFAGQGHKNSGDAILAATSAAQAREWRQLARQEAA